MISVIETRRDEYGSGILELLLGDPPDLPHGCLAMDSANLRPAGSQLPEGFPPQGVHSSALEGEDAHAGTGANHDGGGYKGGRAVKVSALMEVLRRCDPEMGGQSILAFRRKRARNMEEFKVMRSRTRERPIKGRDDVQESTCELSQSF